MFYLVLIIIILKFIYLYYITTTTVVKKIQLHNDKINKPIKIIQLSDFHFGGTGRLEKRVREKLGELEYDLVVLTGDYLSYVDKIDDFVSYMASLDLQSKVIFISGNHDYFKDMPYLIKELTGLGYIYLENKAVTLNINGNKVNVIGVGSPGLGQDDLDKVVSEVDLSTGYNLLLSHTYGIIDEVERNNDFDLILAGDTHGGQIYIPYLSEFLLPNKFQLEYRQGLYEIGENKLYINQGIGTTLIPVRFNTSPEITFFEIYNKL